MPNKFDEIKTGVLTDKTRRREFSITSESWNRTALMCSPDGFGNSCKTHVMLQQTPIQTLWLLLSKRKESLSFSIMGPISK